MSAYNLDCIFPMVNKVVEQMITFFFPGIQTEIATFSLKKYVAFDLINSVIKNESRGFLLKN